MADDDDATLNAKAIKRAERELAKRKERPPAATVDALCAVFSELARVKRERDDKEAWWAAVLAQPVLSHGVGGFATRRGDLHGA